MRDPVKIVATLDKVTTLKDRSLKITFETQEMDSESGAAILDLRGQLGWVVFAPNKTPEVELPDSPAPEFKTDKTPSRRLRDVIFVEWKQMRTRVEFEAYYKGRIEGFIESVKEHLEPMSA